MPVPVADTEEMVIDWEWIWDISTSRSPAFWVVTAREVTAEEVWCETGKPVASLTADHWA